MKVKNLSFSYHQKPFIENLNIEFEENQITTIIGSNGSGKSTLLMLLSRIYKPQTGFIEINQQNIQNYKIKEFAQKVAVVHQKNQINGDQDVKTIVGYGRLPYLHYSQKLSQEDYEIRSNQPKRIQKQNIKKLIRWTTTTCLDCYGFSPKNTLSFIR